MRLQMRWTKFIGEPFELVFIKELMSHNKRRAHEAIMILLQNSTTKTTQRNNGVNWKTTYRVVVKGGNFNSHSITGGYFKRKQSMCMRENISWLWML